MRASRPSLIRLALSAALVATSVLTLVAAPARAAAPEFVYQVTRHAVYQDIPGTAISFSASAAGESSYLWSRHLSTQPVTTLTTGQNIGNTFAIRCFDRAGVAVAGENGAYWATNLVPPGETSVTPTLRWLFVAPAAGTYTCRLSIASYSTILDSGVSVTMRIPAGAEIARRSYPKTSRWTLRAADTALVTSGQTLTTLGATFTPGVAGADRIAITQDAALTTCKYNSSVAGCSGGSSSITSSTVTTWIQGQPQTATGAPCGTLLTSPASSATISNAKHHLSRTHTLYLTESQLGGCARLRVTLKVRVTGGNPVLVHGTDSAIVATHGVAFEYV